MFNNPLFEQIDGMFTMPMYALGTKEKMKIGWHMERVLGALFLFSLFSSPKKRIQKQQPEFILTFRLSKKAIINLICPNCTNAHILQRASCLAYFCEQSASRWYLGLMGICLVAVICSVVFVLTESSKCNFCKGELPKYTIYFFHPFWVFACRAQVADKFVKLEFICHIEAKIAKLLKRHQKFINIFCSYNFFYFKKIPL